MDQNLNQWDWLVVGASAWVWSIWIAYKAGKRRAVLVAADLLQTSKHELGQQLAVMLRVHYIKTRGGRWFGGERKT